MTLQRTSSRWIRGGLAAAVLIAVILAILLLPRVSSGQDGQETPLEDQLMDALTGVEGVDSPADFRNSPYVVGAGYFTPVGNNDGRYSNWGWDGFLDRVNPQDYGYICYVAPVYLENGVRINTLEIYGVDNDNNYIQNRLYRKKYNYGSGGSDQAPELLINHNSAGASPNVVKWTSGSINSVVDNDTYTYYIESCPWSPAHQVYAYRVNWTR